MLGSRARCFIEMRQHLAQISHKTPSQSGALRVKLKISRNFWIIWHFGYVIPGFSITMNLSSVDMKNRTVRFAVILAENFARNVLMPKYGLILYPRFGMLMLGHSLEFCYFLT